MVFQFFFSGITCSSLCRAGAFWFSCVHISMSVALLIQFMFKQSCCWNCSLYFLLLFFYLSVARVVPRRPNLTANSLTLWLLQCLHPLFSSDLWASVQQLLSVGPGFHNFAFWWLVVFCNGLPLSKKTFTWWRVGLYFSVGRRTNI